MVYDERVRMVFGLAIVAVAGCDLVFPLEPPAQLDASPLGACPFLAPTELEPSIISAFDPSLRGDVLELWFSKNGGASDFDLYSVRRPSLTDPFGAEVAADGLNTNVSDTDPALTLDGLRMFYHSDLITEAQRTSATEPFGTGSAHVDLPGNVVGIDISFDGLRIYYDHVDGLRSQARLSLDTPFLMPATDLGPNRRFPSISHDELELFFDDVAGNIYRVLRGSVTARFDGVPELIIAGGDAEISDSGKLLIFRSLVADRLAVSERSCVDR